METLADDKSTFLAVMKEGIEEDEKLKEFVLLMSEIIEDESICNLDS